MYLGCNFGASLSAIVRSFLQQKVNETARELKQHSRSELARAKQLTDLYIADKLPRLGRSKRQQLIGDGAEMVGADHECVNFQPPQPDAAGPILSNVPALHAAAPTNAASNSSKVVPEGCSAPKRFKTSDPTPTASSAESSIVTNSSDDDEEPGNEITQQAMNFPDSSINRFRREIIALQSKHSNKSKADLERDCDKFLQEQCKELGTFQPNLKQCEKILQVIIQANKHLPVLNDLMMFLDELRDEIDNQDSTGNKWTDPKVTGSGQLTLRSLEGATDP